MEKVSEGFFPGGEGGAGGGEVGGNTGVEGLGGGGFEGEVVVGVLEGEEHGFGVLGAVGEVGNGAGDEAVGGFHAFDDGGAVYTADGFDGGQDGVADEGVRGLVEFVEVEAGGFPVFMEAEAEFVAATAGKFFAREEGEVLTGFGGEAVAVVAIHVEAVGIFAGFAEEAAGVDDGEEEPVKAVGEVAGAEEFEEGERAGGFVAMHAGGEVEGGGVRRGGGAAQEEEGVAGGFAIGLDGEARGGGGEREVGVEARDVEGGAEVGHGWEIKN